MKMLQAAWRKIRERFYSSYLVVIGVPTLICGLVLGVLTFGAGIDLGMMGYTPYQGLLVFVSAFIAVGAGATLWGWFFDPVEERPHHPEQSPVCPLCRVPMRERPHHPEQSE